jgi:hypothetical protein
MIKADKSKSPISLSNEQQTNPPKAKRRTLFHPGNQAAKGQGRPVGSRNRLTQRFLETICADFEKHGERVIEKIRREQPAEYLKAVAKLVPKQMEVGEAGAFDSMSDEELDRYIVEKAKEVKDLKKQITEVNGLRLPDRAAAKFQSEPNGKAH